MVKKKVKRALLVRLSVRTQLWLLCHRNFISRWLLKLFYAIEILPALTDSFGFLGDRQHCYGQNFAAVGRVVIGEFEEVNKLLQRPQKRGAYFGAAIVNKKRLPPYFTMLLSDEGAGGTGEHKALHDYLWYEPIVSAQGRLDDEILQTIVSEFIAAARAKGNPPQFSDVKPDFEMAVIRYCMHALFGLSLSPTDPGTRSLHQLFYSKKRDQNYLLSLIEPGSPRKSKVPDINRNIDSAVALIKSSPALADYEERRQKYNAEHSRYENKLDLDEYALLMFNVVGLAALGVANVLAERVLTEIPETFQLGEDKRRSALPAILEIARLRYPVDHVTFIATERMTFTICGKSRTFKPGTPISACIGLAGHDPSVFPDPEKYDASRPNLIPDAAGIVPDFRDFNAVGYYPDTPGTEQTGRRMCPGRNIGLRLSTDMFIAWREAFGR